MTSLLPRTLLRVARPTRVLYRPATVFIWRPISTTPFRRQSPEESAVIEEAETLNDAPDFLDETTQVDWSRSFHGLSEQPFSEEAAKVLMASLDVNDVEIKPGIYRYY